MKASRGPGAALVLLRLIGLITNLVFYQRTSTTLVASARSGTTGPSSCSLRWSAA